MFHKKFVLFSLILKVILYLKVNAAKQDKFKEYERASLNGHNKYRKIHRANDLQLNEQMNLKAEQCAKYYAKLGEMDHSCPNKSMEGKSGQKYGENIYYHECKNCKKSDAEIMNLAADWWYAEWKDYNFKEGTGSINGKEFRHFTQMVWISVKELGAGVSRNGNKVYVVNLYNPFGNIKKKYLENVLDKIGES